MAAVSRLDELRELLDAKEEEMQEAVDADDFERASELQAEVDALNDEIDELEG